MLEQMLSPYGTREFEAWTSKDTTKNTKKLKRLKRDFKWLILTNPLANRTLYRRMRVAAMTRELNKREYTKINSKRKKSNAS